MFQKRTLQIIQSAIIELKGVKNNVQRKFCYQLEKGKA